MDQETKTVLQKLNPQETEKALKSLDQRTLDTAASIITQMGFQHFTLSRDTRLPLEARKAHTFVAINCEELSKKVLRLSGIEEELVENRLRAITQQVVDYAEAQKEKAKKASSIIKPAGMDLQ